VKCFEDRDDFAEHRFDVHQRSRLQTHRRNLPLLALRTVVVRSERTPGVTPQQCHPTSPSNLGLFPGAATTSSSHHTSCAIRSGDPSVRKAGRRTRPRPPHRASGAQAKPSDGASQAERRTGPGSRLDGSGSRCRSRKLFGLRDGRSPPYEVVRWAPDQLRHRHGGIDVHNVPTRGHQPGGELVSHDESQRANLTPSQGVLRVLGELRLELSGPNLGPDYPATAISAEIGRVAIAAAQV
jgi:hypothetical protein